MSAYVVMIRERTLDQAEMTQYAKLATLAREGHEITPLVRYGNMEILEGNAAEGCLIHQFPTIKDAQNWYHSAKYQEAVKHRHKGAKYRVLIVEGVED
jgi:uncharacterized protein (DUF1330 family)